MFMPCTKPVLGYYSDESDGKDLFFKPFQSEFAYIINVNNPSDNCLLLPCGKCLDCRFRYADEWARRCVHEASLYRKNCFLTLTYDSENLPEGGTLVKSHYQNFLKRLRKEFKGFDKVKGSKEPYPIRYFLCGEYGSKTFRAHYHVLLFNFAFEDAQLFEKRETGDLYVSPTLSRLWSFGRAIIGELNQKTAAYVARYVFKKQHSDSKFYEEGRLPEFTAMSTSPGIGAYWYKKFKSDVYPNDCLVSVDEHGVKKRKPPRFYDRLFEREFPEEMEAIKNKRFEFAKKKKEKNYFERLKSREYIQEERLKKLLRTLEQTL